MHVMMKTLWKERRSSTVQADRATAPTPALPVAAASLPLPHPRGGGGVDGRLCESATKLPSSWPPEAACACRKRSASEPCRANGDMRRSGVAVGDTLGAGDAEGGRRNGGGGDTGRARGGLPGMAAGAARPKPATGAPPAITAWNKRRVAARTRGICTPSKLTGGSPPAYDEHHDREGERGMLLHCTKQTSCCHGLPNSPSAGHHARTSALPSPSTSAWHLCLLPLGPLPPCAHARGNGHAHPCLAACRSQRWPSRLRCLPPPHRPARPPALRWQSAPRHAPP